jgi:hypothetical protein
MDQSVLVDILHSHSSPISRHGEKGYVIYEADLACIRAKLARHVEARKFDGLITYLNRLYSWGQNVFGPASRTLGVLDHIRKELVEIEKAPDDLEEWIDVMTLAFSGAMRRGFTPWQIIKMLLFKMEKNENRQWPDWRLADPGKAVEHVR